VNHGPEGQHIRHLPMEPDILIRREDRCNLGADKANDIADYIGGF